MEFIATTVTIFILLLSYGEGTEVEIVSYFPTLSNGIGVVCSEDVVFVKCLVERSGTLTWEFNPQVASSFVASAEEPPTFLEEDEDVHILVTGASLDTVAPRNSNISSILWFRVGKVLENSLTITCVDISDTDPATLTLRKPEFPPNLEIVRATGTTYNGTASMFVEWNILSNTVDTYEVEVDWIDTLENRIIRGSANENNTASLIIEHGSEDVSKRFQVRVRTKNICNETEETTEHPIEVEDITDKMPLPTMTTNDNGKTANNTDPEKDNNDGGDVSRVPFIVSVISGLLFGTILGYTGGIITVILFRLCGKKFKWIHQPTESTETAETEMEKTF